MRPLRLTVEGFRSYVDRAEFDFHERSLVGVVGPTGSGKSSILDAITFALYGRTPSLPGNATKPLINRWDPAREQAPGNAKVELWFEVGGVTYRVVRTVKPKGPGGQVLERWDRVDGEKQETVTDKAKGIADTVEDLVGLDFDAFMRSVLLAQNQFAQLLGASPADGAKVLTGLFGFGVIEEMRSITRQRLTVVEAELAAAEKARAELDDLRDRAEAAVASRDAAEARRVELAAIGDDLVAVVTRIGASITAAAAAEEQAGRIAGALAGLPGPGEVEAILSEARSHEDLLAAAVAAAADARAAYEAADAALDDALDRQVPDRLAELASAIDALGAREEALAVAARRREQATAALETAAAAHEAAEQAAAAAAADVEAAARASTEAAAALRVVEAGHAAHLLAAELQPGEPCPVCTRPVSEVPELDDVDDLDAARTEAVLATERAERAALARRRAEHELVTATARLEAARETAETVGRAGDDATVARDGATTIVGELVGALGGDPGEPVTALAAARAEYEGLASAKRRAAESLARATAAVEGLRKAEVGAAVERLVAVHAEAAAVIDLPVDTRADLAAAPDLVASVRAGLAAAGDEATAAAAAARADLASAEAERGALLASVGLDPAADHAAELRVAGERAAAARAKAEVLGDQVQRGERALADAEETAVLGRRLERLHADLAPGKFPQYLIDEKRRELAVVGSDWLRRLSSGRYEFALLDNRFKIRELTAAGIVRDAETLSGGETFLASLALALGLASIIGLERGTAQAFFIDEGFGSLDAEALDLAMEGVERVVGEEGGRLVVVVSHVPEMRARLEDLIVLGKDEVTGATVVHRP